MAVFDVKEWLGSLKTKYNIPDTEIPEKEIEGGFMRQDSFSRRQQQLDQEHAARMAKEDEYHQSLSVHEQRLQTLRDLESRFGPMDTWSDALTNSINIQHPELNMPNNGNGGYSIDDVNQIVADAVNKTREELAQQINRVANGSAVMIDFMYSAPQMWRDKYGSAFPKDEFTKFFNEEAARSGVVDPHIAFRLFEQPFAEKKLREDTEAKIEAARNEGIQSTMSKYGIVDSPASPAGQGMLFTDHRERQQVDPATGNVIQQPDPNPTREESRAKVGKAFNDAFTAATSGKVPGVS